MPDLPQAEDNSFLMVPMSREAVEREIMLELMAFRDERLLRSLTEEQRQRLGENPAGQIMHLSTAQIARRGSFSSGVGCHGTPTFSYGITCKVLRIPPPPAPPPIEDLTTG